MSKITIDRELLEQAIEALSYCEPDWKENTHGFDLWANVLPPLREALAQPQPVQQEPYAWHYTNNGGVSVWHIGPSSRLAADIKAAREFPKVHRIVALHTSPQEAHPMSDEFLRKMHHEDQFGLFCDYDDFEQIARAIEQAHGITKGTT